MPGATTTSAPATHLMAWITQGDKVVGWEVLDLAGGEYKPLTKELGYRAVAAAPHLAGEPWWLALRLEQAAVSKTVGRRQAAVGSEEEAGTAASGFPPVFPADCLLPTDDCPLPTGSHLCLEAHADAGCQGRPLGSLSLPLRSLSWLGRQMARQCGLKGHCTLCVDVLQPDDPRVTHWAAQDAEDADFTITESTPPRLTLPTGFVPSPLGRRRILRSVGSWLHCVFQRPAFERFLDAASQATDEERGWAVATRVHLLPEGCYAVIEELTEMPATAGRSFIVTRGRDFLLLRQKLGERLGGFCHLHPPHVEGEALSPAPSGPDSVVAWNLDAVTASPVVAPIAMFGTTADTLGNNIAAHGYQGGLLTEIDLEVLT